MIQTTLFNCHEASYNTYFYCLKNVYLPLKLKLINSLETIFRECLNVISQQEAAQKFYSKTIGGMFTKENAAWARDCLES